MGDSMKLIYFLIYLILFAGTAFTGYQVGFENARLTLHNDPQTVYVDRPTPTPHYIDKDIVIVAINERRLAANLPQLAVNKELEDLAYTELKTACAGNLSHQPFIDADLKDTGEVLVKEMGDSRSSVAAWFNSPTHKDILLDTRITRLGIAIDNDQECVRALVR